METQNILIIFLTIILLFESILIIKLIEKSNLILKRLSLHSQELQVGSKAPIYKLQTHQENHQISTENHPHKLLFTFVSRQCGGCQRKIRSFDKYYPVALKEDNIQIVFIVDGNKEESQALIEEFNIQSVPVISAPRAKNLFAREFNAKATTPSMILIDENGIVVESDNYSNFWSRLEAKWQIYENPSENFRVEKYVYGRKLSANIKENTLPTTE